MALISSTPQMKYDVFLSFRGIDTRNTLTSHLCKALRDKQIETFMDDKLNRGDEISPSLLSTIEESHISIVIFSKNYASSGWCLEELEKIVERRENHKQIVIPVFYEIDPTDVRNQTGSYAEALVRDEQRLMESFDKVQRVQTWKDAANLSGLNSLLINYYLGVGNRQGLVRKLGNRLGLVRKLGNRQGLVRKLRVMQKHLLSITGSYAEAFAQHEQRVIKRVQTWKDALRQAANLSGFDSSVIKPEAVFVKNIVDDVLKKLNKMSPSYNTDLPGMNSRIKEIESLLMGGDVRSLGIWGIGGIGKTTLAQEVAKKISCQFESSCFVGSVREYSKKGGLDSLRQSLLSTLLMDENAYMGTFTEKRLGRKKVFIILDDVTNFGQIEHLIGDLECLDSKSRIIVTSRDRQVLQNCRVHHIYQVEELCFNDAFKLFYQYAFRQNCSKVDYKELSNSVVEKVGRVPLALKVLGSALFEKPKEVWESALEKLENSFDEDIHDALKISYDELKDNEKSIFLDIACFYKGWNIDTVKVIMDACGFSSWFGISNLIDKSLITVSGNTLTMHDLLQKMGKKLVQQESNNPSKGSRLWRHRDIYDALTKAKGTKRTEAISLDMSSSEVRDIKINPLAFKKTKKLRLLNFHVKNVWENSNKVHIPDDLFESNLTELKYLHWDRCPLKSFQQKFHFEKLVVLEMRNSNIEELWSNDIVQTLHNLKKIDLSSSQHLISCPDLSLVPNLESLMLSECTSLESIPDCTCLESLTNLGISFCSKLKRLPQLPPNLEDIGLDYCPSLVEIQSSSTHLHKVRSLILRNLYSLTSIPDLRGLKSITNLEIFSCSKLKMLPELPPNLEYITFDDCTSLVEIQSSFTHLHKVRSLFLEHLDSLTSIPDLRGLKSLTSLSISSCSKLKMLPELPPNLEGIGLYGCKSLVEIQSSFTHLHKVRSLFLYRLYSLTSFPDLRGLKSLTKLDISYCSKLKMLPELPNNIEELNLEDVPIEVFPPSCEDLDRLRYLHLKEFPMLKSLPSSVRKWKSLYNFSMTNCSKIDKLPDDIGALESLEYFTVAGTAIGEVPSSISCLKSLTDLSISRCEGVDGAGLLLPPNLYELILSDCGIATLPDCLWYLTSLHRLSLGRNNFESIPGSIINLSKLESLDISHCKRLRELPQLPAVTNIIAANCTSLERLSNFEFQNDIFEEPLAQDANFINCCKLDQDALNDVVYDTRRKIKGQADLVKKDTLRKIYDKQNVDYELDLLPASIIYPGSKIPKWFENQSGESFIEVELPSDCLNSNFLCFALCIVVAPNLDPNPDRQCNHPNFDHMPSKVTFDCYIKSKDGNESNLFGHHQYLVEPQISLKMPYCGPAYLKSNHVITYFGYYFFRDFCDNEFSFKFNIEYFDGEWFYDDAKEHFKVEMCGVHLMSHLHLEVSDEEDEPHTKRLKQILPLV